MSASVSPARMRAHAARNCAFAVVEIAARSAAAARLAGALQVQRHCGT
jgi:hypothetical protein